MKRAILLMVFAMSLALGSSKACYLSCPASPQVVQKSIPIWFDMAWWQIFSLF